MLAKRAKTATTTKSSTNVKADCFLGLLNRLIIVIFL